MQKKKQKPRIYLVAFRRLCSGVLEAFFFSLALHFQKKQTSPPALSFTAEKKLRTLPRYGVDLSSRLCVESRASQRKERVAKAETKGKDDGSRRSSSVA